MKERDAEAVESPNAGGEPPAAPAETVEDRLREDLRLARLEMQLLYESPVMRLIQFWATHVSGSSWGRFAENALERVLFGPWRSKESRAEARSGSQRTPSPAAEDLEAILRDHPDRKGIIVFFPTVDWNVPLYQRPQHMALQLARLGYLFFYVTPGHYEGVRGFLPLAPNLYLTDRLDLLCHRLEGAFFDLYSTSPVSPEPVAKAQERNFLLYEYIDHIDERISGRKARTLRTRHAALRPSLAAASAGRLRDELAARLGEDRVLLLPNGADYDHFHIRREATPVPADLRPIVAANRPIIGYYGALAGWIDYDLLNRMAARRPDWNLVLLGVDYDGSLKRLQRRGNVHFLGRKHYSLLPEYGIRFDVAIIPFSRGAIAQTTSPLKLFEYMAMGKPVVTTDMDECKRFRSVRWAKDAEGFLAAVEEALARRDDPGFLETVDREARANTWRARAEALDAALRKVADLHRAAAGHGGSGQRAGTRSSRSSV